MRTSADSLREQAARFSAMAEMARADGKTALADLLTEAARRAAVFESLPKTMSDPDAAQAEQPDGEFQQAAE